MRFFNHEKHKKHEKTGAGIAGGIVRGLLALKGVVG